MNRAVTPKQLDLVKELSREEIILASAPHIDPDSPALKADVEKIKRIEIAEAATAVLASDEEDFNWFADESIILREQRATAVYHNKHGELIIRQKADWCDDNDTFVYVTPENCNAFMDGVAARIRSGN